MGVAVIETKGQPPVATDGDCPAALHFAFEGVQAKPRYIHIVNSFCSIQRGQLHAQSLGMGRLHA